MKKIYAFLSVILIAISTILVETWTTTAIYQHDPPRHACSPNPKKNQVNCKCRRHELECEEDGKRPPARGGRQECGSWCFEAMCLCADDCAKPE